MWKIAFWILFLAAASWEVVLHALEWRHLKTLEGGPPQEMIRILPDNYNWHRGIKYAQDHLRLGLGETLSSYALMAVAIESGLYAAVSSWAGMTFTSSFLAGLLFGVVASATVWLVQLPWEWSEVFRVEESYGFNRASPALFWRDQLVKLSFLCAIGGGLLGSLTWLSGKPLLQVGSSAGRGLTPADRGPPSKRRFSAGQSLGGGCLEEIPSRQCLPGRVGEGEEGGPFRYADALLSPSGDIGYHRA